MPINESLLKRIKCCLSKDEHITLDPVLVIECQNTVCKQCIFDSKDENKIFIVMDAKINMKKQVY